MLEGFGIPDHDRVGFYSLLHVDVKIYWQLLRMLYSYSGMATLRHDLFFCFGLWHAYCYAHIAVWTAFRHTFLADVFWSVFPKQRLLRRPPLVQSSTLFTWLRLAYPYFRPQLLARDDGMLTYDIKLMKSIESGLKVPKLNPHRARYIRLINFQT